MTPMTAATRELEAEQALEAAIARGATQIELDLLYAELNAARAATAAQAAA